MSSSNRASLPSMTNDIHKRLARASEVRLFSRAPVTIECALFGLKTCFPVISWATFPKAEVTWSPNLPTFCNRRKGVTEPERLWFAFFPPSMLRLS